MAQLCGYRMAVCQWLTLMTTGGLPGSQAAAAEHQRDDLIHTASPGKDPDAKFKVRFLPNVYCFCTTVKLK